MEMEMQNYPILSSGGRIAERIGEDKRFWAAG
jgi:hypothetical protein